MRTTLLGLSVFFLSLNAFADIDGGTTQQKKYEQEIDAVVQQKNYYKAGHVELAATVGGTPYDSLVSHVVYGGRFSWHISDHWGWEVIDGQVANGALDAYTTSLVDTKVISNLQVPQLKTLATTGLLVTPLYGKIRFFGRQVLYFDIYFTLGMGASNVDIVKLSKMSSSSSVVQTTEATGWYPTGAVGLGVKIFASDLIGIFVDFRDYIISAPLYSTNRIRHNLVATAGLNLYVPWF